MTRAGDKALSQIEPVVTVGNKETAIEAFMCKDRIAVKYRIPLLRGITARIGNAACIAAGAKLIRRGINAY